MGVGVSGVEVSGVRLLVGETSMTAVGVEAREQAEKRKDERRRKKRT